MIEFDLIKLKKYIDNLDALINRYENIQLNIFNLLKNVCVDWQGASSLAFDNKIYLEKQESALFLEMLKEKRDVFLYLYDECIEIGKKIKCDVVKKDTVIKKIDFCIQKINEVLNEFSNVDDSFYYPEYKLILQQKGIVKKQKDRLLKYKLSFKKMIEKINMIELETCLMNDKINNVKINDFEFM